MFFSLFHKIPKAFSEGFVPVDNGHALHFAEFGNPKGQVVVNFHGGPGGSFRAEQAEKYDLKKYRVILFSQRGCGLSKYTDLLKENTSQAAVSDAVALLKYLNIPMQNLIIGGASYGATLALLFAEKHPNAVQKLVLNSVFLARKQDLLWTRETSACFYPDLMDEMKKPLKPGESLLDGYTRLLFSGNYEEMKTAQKYYGSYERCLGKTNALFKEVTALNDRQVNSFKIALTYEQNNMFLADNEILNNIKKIKHIPTLIVHNRLDMVCPIDQAWALSRALEKCRFEIVANIGHGSDKLHTVLKKHIKQFLAHNFE